MKNGPPQRSILALEGAFYPRRPLSKLFRQLLARTVVRAATAAATVRAARTRAAALARSGVVGVGRAALVGAAAIRVGLAADPKVIGAAARPHGPAHAARGRATGLA